MLSSDIALRPNKFITRTVARHRTDASGLRQTSYHTFSSSSEDLRLRSLVSLQRQHVQTSSGSPLEPGCLTFHASHRSTVDGAEIMYGFRIVLA
ncbi:unnamed protein product [Enterobius vermicularis]|uniref:Uncharacterized protein n=1 Tax=Enterobius vermicularis TaxID=51028 RepID=A0A0N4V8E7_ENTVE|nr:unnamed protein product [Enterobius vermicularis]